MMGKFSKLCYYFSACLKIWTDRPLKMPERVYWVSTFFSQLFKNINVLLLRNTFGTEKLQPIVNFTIIKLSQIGHTVATKKLSHKSARKKQPSKLSKKANICGFFSQSPLTLSLELDLELVCTKNNLRNSESKSKNQMPYFR